GIARAAHEDEIEELLGRRPTRSRLQVVVQSLSQAASGLEAEEPAPRPGSPRRTLVRRQAADPLLELLEVASLALLELLELALPAIVEALERVGPAGVELLERHADLAHHGERRDQRREAVRTAKHGPGAIARERHRVFALAAEAGDRDLPLLE